MPRRSRHLFHVENWLKVIQAVKNLYEQDGPDQVEVQVDHSCAARIFPGPDRRNESRHTRTDILSHDDRDDSPVRDDTRERQCLEDSARRRGGLDDLW